MITSTEIKAQARIVGVPASTIERDYAQNWLLRSINILSVNMVLKGGTGIRKAYIQGYRFSDDLDFTLLEDSDLGQVRDTISAAIEDSKKESGIDFSEEAVLKENVNGFEGIVYFRILRTAGSPLRIKLDITRHDMEEILLGLEKIKIIHPYSDAFNADILVYRLEEIIAEKLRALFERTRPRDIYDIWYMKGRLKKEEIQKVFWEKCKLKMVKPGLESIVGRKEDFKGAWENSLGHQVKALPDFETAFDDTLKLVGNIIKK